MSRALAVTFVCFLLAATAAAQCAYSSTNKTVNICAPASGATVGSPVQISASAYDTSASVTAMAVYLDYTKVYSSSSSQVSTSLSMAAGSHHLTIKAWDAAGAVFSSSENFSVSSGGSSGSCTPTATNQTVTICTPASGSTVDSPVQITAAAYDTSASVTAMAVYVDYTKTFSTNSSTVSTSQALAAGSHHLTVKAWDASGAVFSHSEDFTVGSGGSSTCTATGGDRTVTVCSPVNNSTVTSPVHITAAANDTATVSAMQVYLDGSKVYQTSASSIDTSLSMASGVHKITVKAWDASGSFSQSVYISVSSTTTSGIDAVNHVIFYMHENRSFDSYFGMLNPYREAHGFTTSTDGHAYSVDGIDDKLNTITNADDEGQYFYLFNTTSSCLDDMTSDWLGSYGDVYRWNFSTSRPINMDGFVHIAENYGKSGAGAGTFTDTTGQRAMAYYKDTNPDGTPALNYYYYMASQFGLSDRWFAPVASKTIPNRIAAMTGGTTLGYTHDPIHDDGTGQLTATTIFELLDQHNISWKIYYESTNSDGTPTTTFSYFTYANNFIQKTSSGVWIDSKHLAPISQYYTDVQNGTLPAFAYIEKTDTLDEHPGSGTPIFNGQQDTAKIINALMYSPSWKDSVFFFSFDEPGGPYDHVPPVPGHTNDFTSSSLSSVEGDVSPIAVNPDGYLPCLPTTAGVYNNHCDLRSTDPGAKSTDAPAVYGFAAQIGSRVPNMIISPFTRPHYVGHKAMDHTAVLRFLEERFGLPALTKRDAAQPDLLDFFDFTNKPWATPPPQSSLPVPPSAGSTCHADQMQ